MTAPELWAWAPDADAEEWQGPFVTRFEAEARGHAYAACDENPYQDGHLDGHEGCEDYFCAAALGVISRAEWIDRDRIVVDMVDGILTDILDHLNDETPWGFEDGGHFGHKDGAEEALAVLLVAWSKEWITGSAWQVTGDCEPVTGDCEPVTLPTEPARCATCGQCPICHLSPDQTGDILPHRSCARHAAHGGRIPPCLLPTEPAHHEHCDTLDPHALLFPLTAKPCNCRNRALPTEPAK